MSIAKLHWLGYLFRFRGGGSLESLETDWKQWGFYFVYVLLSCLFLHHCPVSLINNYLLLSSLLLISPWVIL